MSTDPMMEKLFADAATLHAAPFWTRTEEVRPNEPVPRAVPCLWRYAQMRELLDRASGLVVGRDAAERRVFILANPAMDARYTTDGVLAALQLLLPGEIASAHRHTASAIRFVIEGHGAYTAVGGARIPMEPGDLVVTPSRDYHDHGSEGEGPVVWLDALDLPLFHMLPTNFSNEYDEATHPSVLSPESPLIHRWDEMQQRLDDVPGATATAEYIDPIHRGPILRNLRATAVRIAPGSETSLTRETCSGVYLVVSGTGTTRAGNDIMSWSAGDVFAVPGWTRFSHANTSSTAAYLFRIDERPALEKLGMYTTDAQLLAEADRSQ